jgi:Alpha-kinase family
LTPNLVLDLKAADGFLLTVTKGHHQGQTWLVDPLLDSSKFHKFSGSDAAGNNCDFMGMTCDAFAHWVLNDSDNTLEDDGS